MYHKNGRCESSCLRESLEAKYLLKTRKNVFLDTLDVPVDKSEHFMKKYFWVKKSQKLLIFTFQLFFHEKNPISDGCAKNGLEKIFKVPYLRRYTSKHLSTSQKSCLMSWRPPRKIIMVISLLSEPLHFFPQK